MRFDKIGEMSDRLLERKLFGLTEIEALNPRRFNQWQKVSIQAFRRTYPSISAKRLRDGCSARNHRSSGDCDQI